MACAGAFVHDMLTESPFQALASVCFLSGTYTPCMPGAPAAGAAAPAHLRQRRRGRGLCRGRGRERRRRGTPVRQCAAALHGRGRRPRSGAPGVWKRCNWKSLSYLILARQTATSSLTVCCPACMPTWRSTRLCKQLPVMCTRLHAVCHLLASPAPPACREQTPGPQSKSRTHSCCDARGAGRTAARPCTHRNLLPRVKPRSHQAQSACKPCLHSAV